MNLLCRLFGHKMLKKKGDQVYYSAQGNLCWRCGTLRARKPS